MKRLMMVLLTVCLGFAIQAQPGNGKPPSLEEKIERAKTHLNLSDSQVAQWKAIHEKYEDDMKSARRSESSEKSKAFREKIDKELNAILDEEQKKKFTEMKENRPKRRKRGRQ